LNNETKKSVFESLIALVIEQGRWWSRWRHQQR